MQQSGSMHGRSMGINPAATREHAGARCSLCPHRSGIGVVMMMSEVAFCPVPMPLDPSFGTYARSVHACVRVRTAQQCLVEQSALQRGEPAPPQGPSKRTIPYHLCQEGAQVLHVYVACAVRVILLPLLDKRLHIILQPGVCALCNRTRTKVGPNGVACSGAARPQMAHRYAV